MLSYLSNFSYISSAVVIGINLDSGILTVSLIPSITSLIILLDYTNSLTGTLTLHPKDTYPALKFVVPMFEYPIALEAITYKA